MTRRFNSRLKSHLIIIAGSIVLLLLFHGLIPGDDQKYLWSMATGYTSIILLAITVIVGPLNVIRQKNNPVSTDLRRDLGIWCGIIGLAHIVVGIQVHMGNIWLYFVKNIDDTNTFALRSDLFGAANYTGLVAGLVVLMLLLLSNDLSLALLKPARWKRLQQWSYVAFILIFGHSIMYQVIEKRSALIVVIFIFIMITPLAFQWVGFRHISRFKKPL